MERFAVRQVKLVFQIEENDESGKLARVHEQPVIVLEAQFDTSVGSLVQQLLAQANRSSEGAAVVEAPKEE
jgi:hypothetical protein